MSKLSQDENVLLIEQYLTQNFEFRCNIVSKMIEVRINGENDFRPLTDKMRNSIVRRVRLNVPETINVKQNVAEYIDSEDIKQYDPIREWLSSLPKWDGQDHVRQLFERIPGISDEQLQWLAIWMRSTVAHWLGKDILHGNECVPTLIGAQGCGKSTFWQRLLPAHLRVYFLDHLNLSNKNDKEMALTNNLLVNLDEIDQIRPSQQSELKQTLSKVKVNGRPIYGREQHDRTRYASFVATTNNLHPLKDPTGSRRYICMLVADRQLIDNDSAIDYLQLYAQVKEEIEEKEMRHWFTNEETLRIQQANEQFQEEQNLDNMLEACFRLPESSESGTEMSVKQIITLLGHQYPTIQKSHSLSIHVGMALQQQGFERRHSRDGVVYQVVPKIAG